MLRLKAALFALVLTATGSSNSDMDVAVGGEASNAKLTANARAAWSPTEASSTAQASSDGLRDRFMRREVCGDWFVNTEGVMPQLQVWEGSIPECVEPHVVDPDLCPGQTTPLAPLWASRVQADGSYGPWTQASGYQCPEDPLPAAIAEAWRTMTITPSPVTIQPDNGWVIASMGLIPSTTSDPQTSPVTVLGIPVILRATPTQFTWTATDLDGTVLFEESTAQPGKTFEQGGEPLTFDRREHRTRLSLTTTWEGHYSLNNGTSWQSAPGTATTTTAPMSIHVYNPRTRLVSSPDERGRHTVDAPTRTDPDNDGIDNYTIADEHISAYLETRKNGKPWRQP